MMKKYLQDLYKEHYVDKEFERMELFKILRDKYGINSAIYPGSFVHVTPSFVFPITTYIEMDKRAIKFFKDPQLNNFVDDHKIYSEELQIKFFAKDYRENITGEDENYDLLISQYSGFVSKHCKQYLKIGGVLLVNNSHGDAGMASIDRDFEFVGVVLKRGYKYKISEKKLAEYFIPKKSIQITKEYLEEIGKGIGYTKMASSYLFRKLK